MQLIQKKQIYTLRINAHFAEKPITMSPRLLLVMECAFAMNVYLSA